METQKGINTERKATTVTFLNKPEVSFVSLVKHGANNTPFRVIKSSKEGRMNKVVQAIRVLKNSEADLETLIGKDFRKDSVTEKGDYLIYEQVDKSVCDTKTKSVVVLDPDKHVYAITYDLLADNSTEKGNKKTTEEDGKEKAPNTVVLKENIEELSYWDVWDEMYAMTDVISGSMSQSARSTEDRKDMVLAAIDHFRSFCETIFSEIKSTSPLPTEKRLGERTLKLLEIAQKHVSVKQEKEGGNMFEIESKDALVALITETVGKAMEAKAEKDAKSIEAKAKADADAKKAEDEKAAMDTLKKTVDTLKEDLAALSGTIVSKSNEEDSEASYSRKDTSPYTGMFGGLRSTPIGISGAV